ncbi:hypothetical protein GQ457_18G018730 [Hibiscus cannabinus]
MAKLASIRRKRITLPRTTRDSETNSCSTSSEVVKGHFVVYSVDHKRFVLPLEYLKTKIVMELFNLAEESLDYQAMGFSSCLVMQILWNILAKKWQKLASIRRKRTHYQEPRRDSETNGLQHITVVDKGHFVVYSVDQKRFVLPLEYLKNSIMMELFNLAEEEFGLPGNGFFSCLKPSEELEKEKALIMSVTVSTNRLHSVWVLCIILLQHISCLSLWLNPPTIEKLVENDVLSEFASISEEAYLVLESLARTLPNFYSHKILSDSIPEGTDDNVETWSWIHVGPMVDLAVKWISLTVMHMLSRVLEKVIPDDTMDIQEGGGRVPWLPDFVPKVGLEIIRNGFLSFTHGNSADYGTNLAAGSSFIEQLCSLRKQSESETSFASLCCLHGSSSPVFIYINNLIQLTKTTVCNPSQGCNLSHEENILAKGILVESMFELRCVFDIFSKLVASEWHFVQSIEIFGRGGPAPGVGLGWGASGGGFWSKVVLLAQTDAWLLSQLLEIFESIFTEVLSLDEERTFTREIILSALGLCLIAGPRDKVIVEKALDVMLQVPVLKYLNLCIQHESQDHNCTSLMTEWAHQRLPLPMHWFLSPISTLCASKHAGLGKASDLQNILQDPGHIVEVSRAGMFFLLGWKPCPLSCLQMSSHPFVVFR